VSARWGRLGSAKNARLQALARVVGDLEDFKKSKFEAIVFPASITLQ
jgi:hypothetical protein